MTAAMLGLPRRLFCSFRVSCLPSSMLFKSCSGSTWPSPIPARCSKRASSAARNSVQENRNRSREGDHLQGSDHLRRRRTTDVSDVAPDDALSARRLRSDTSDNTSLRIEGRRRGNRRDQVRRSGQSDFRDRLRRKCRAIQSSTASCRAR